MRATRKRAARIVGTRIAINAIRHNSSTAGPAGAFLSGGASIAVVAHDREIRILASRSHVARIGRADVPVIADRRSTRQANARRARLRPRTGIASAADHDRSRIHSADIPGADERAVAGIPVLKGNAVSIGLTLARIDPARADTAAAHINVCTGIAVIASGRVVDVGTPAAHRTTRIVGTDVPVIADRVTRKDTPIFRVATVVGTDHTVNTSRESGTNS